jgi:hypothetical protein
MPDVSQVLNAAQYIAPGFLFVQVLYLLKVSFVRQRSDFERGAWSVILSVPIHWVGMQFITLLDLELTQSFTFEVYLLAIALVVGLVIGLLNQLLFFEEEEESPYSEN